MGCYPTASPAILGAESARLIKWMVHKVLFTALPSFADAQHIPGVLPGQVFTPWFPPGRATTLLE
jgi:hypothetical protein